MGKIFFPRGNADDTENCSTSRKFNVAKQMCATKAKEKQSLPGRANLTTNTLHRLHRNHPITLFAPEPFGCPPHPRLHPSRLSSARNCSGHEMNAKQVPNRTTVMYSLHVSHHNRDLTLTTPRRNMSHRGSSSSNLSLMNTRLT